MSKISFFSLIFLLCVVGGCNSGHNNNGFDNTQNETQPIPKTPEELRQELLELEQQNPKDYLVNDGTFRENLLGEMVLEGTVANSATMAEFKDVVLSITWLSKTETELGSTEETMYEFIGPGKSVAYKFKFFAPNDTKRVRVTVKNAKVSK